MIRKLLMTTAISLIATSGALAQDTKDSTAQPMEGYLQEQGQAALASNMIGETVYTSDAADAESIGDINDLVVGEDGSINAVVIGVGGFLGVGEKNVAVNFDQIRWAEDDSGDQIAVFEASKEDLQNAPEFVPAEETAMAPADENAADADAETAEAPADATAEPAMEETAEAPADQPAESQEMAAAPAEEPATAEEPAAEETAMAPAEPAADAVAPADQPADQMAQADQAAGPVLTDVEAGSVSADSLIGATVYATANEENVGEVSDIRLKADDGAIEAIIVDVGGFLGIGEKPVAISFQNLQFKTDESGAFYVYTDFTREELEGAPNYDEAAYDTDRDSMLLTSGN
jgi:sporulation protein YlmC with PRC-barrel domain